MGIKPILLKRDIIAQAQSGSGKTATFSIGLLQNLDEKQFYTQILILANTRELAQQICGVINKLGYYMPINAIICVGGTPLRQNLADLQNNPHVVVGTPGRVLHLITKKFLNIQLLKMMVFDEADDLLSFGFFDTIKSILESVPEKAQLCFFSATIGKQLFELTKDVIQNPVKILVKKEELTLKGIKQYYMVATNQENKFELVQKIFKNVNVQQSIIFVQNKEVVQELCKKLQGMEYSVSMIYGTMEQRDRNKTMKLFREGLTRVLVATDLVARGIDVQQVDVVINFNLPVNKENYIHRIGRSGRYGKRGIAINIIVANEIDRMDDIMKYYQTQINQIKPDNISKIKK